MQRSFEYQVAEAILSGRPAPQLPAPAEIDDSRREPKICELCARTFIRPIGSKQRDCGRHGSRGFQ